MYLHGNCAINSLANADCLRSDVTQNNLFADVAP